jgi:nucleotidyltransferase/DNA polymerase involved in DNA repair
MRAKPVNAIVTSVTKQLFRAARAGVHNILKGVQSEEKLLNRSSWEHNSKK